MTVFTRPIARILRDRIREPRRFMQALIGPRQTGKTTIARQILSDLEMPSHYASADEPLPKDSVCEGSHLAF